jgi:hypothetical protein
MNFMLQTRSRRFALYALTIVSGMLVSCVVLGMIGYNSNQQLPTAPHITDQLDPLDKMRLSEALRLKAELGDQIWPGYADLEAPVIIWNEEYEFLFQVERPPTDWEEVKGDTYQGKPYYRRPADDPQNFAVLVDDQWTASIFTKYLIDVGLISGIKGLLPPLIADIFPYRLIIQPSELQISAVQHEYFHVFQAEEVPQKFDSAEETYEFADSYWELDPQMWDAWREEVDLLIKAIGASSDGDAADITRQFLIQRDQRRRDHALGAELIAYEQLSEWLEGTAKYVELRSWEAAFRDHGYLSLPEMQADEDFRNYDSFESHWDREISQAKRQAGEEGDVRFYYSGMLQAYLLDRLTPDWKVKIMEEGIYLDDLLRDAVAR